MDLRDLTKEQKADLVDEAKKKYLAGGQRQNLSIATLGAMVLFDALAADVRKTGNLDGFTRFAIKDLQDAIEADHRFAAGFFPAFKDVPSDIEKQLENFRPRVEASGMVWQLAFRGPTGKGRGGKRGDGYGLAVRITLVGAKSDTGTPAPEVFAHLLGRCFCCGTVQDPYTGSTPCVGPACFLAGANLESRNRFVTVIAERRGADYAGAQLPSLDECVDFFANTTGACSNVSDGAGEYAGILPYTRDHLSSLGLRLGNSFLFSAPYLSTPFADVKVLDMATYQWSHTLKDPKSWAVVNVAIEHDIRSLVAATAGNVGLSLARLLYHLNRRHTPAISLHAQVDPSVSRNVRTTLLSWGSNVEQLDTYGTHAIPPRNSVSTSEDGETGWYVTDGWDGLAPAMYRVLFAQVLRQQEFDYVVVPVGTGSLIVGAHLGIKDSGSKARLVGALPFGKNILTETADLGVGVKGTSVFSTSKVPTAPKLSGWYSPLGACVAFLAQKSDTWFIDVTKDMQIAAAKRLSGRRRYRLAAEPSALIAFGALNGYARFKGLAERARQEEGVPISAALAARVLVVNSGSGLLSKSEELFLEKNLSP